MNRLKASTVVELLVVMILSSIVLAIVMEGWTIFRLYTQRTFDHQEQQSQFIDDYLLLESMCYLSDSVLYDKGCLNFYSADTIRWSLTDRDSIMLGVQLIDRCSDSLVVWLAKDRGEALRFAFPIGISGVSKREDEKYGYEE